MPGGRMTVRETRAEEFETVGQLVVSAYVGEGLVDADSGYVNELRDTAARSRDADLLVAVDEGQAQLLGTVTYCAGGSRYSEVAVPGEADFRMLAVDGAARGRGVGETLVRACLDRARAAGASTMRLSTKENMHAAHRLYERLGFHRTPELDWSPDADIKLLTYALDL